MERFKVFLIMLLGMVMSIITPLDTAQAESLTNDFAYPLANQEGQLARSIEQLESAGYDYHISQGFNNPYSDGYCSVSPYTQSSSDCPGTWRYGHDGLDISNYACYSPVYASASGVVTNAESESGWGNQIRIRHLTSDGYRYILYGHLDSMSVSKGESVSQGQKIGTIGNGGVSTACHLHFGVLTEDINGSGYYYDNMPSTHLDPTDFIASHQIDCSAYASQISAVKSNYGSMIGTFTNEPHPYYQNGEYTNTTCLQDYNSSGTSDGTSAILFDYEGGANQAYLVRSGFWSLYSNTCSGPSGNCNQNGVVDCGNPITDEYTQSNGTARQDFQTCYLYWNGSSASANPYPEVAPGWFESGGWNSTHSYAFAEAYERNGARNTMGEPYDMVDGASVHHWGNDSDLPYVQDYNGGSYGWAVIMLNDTQNTAYAIREGMWTQYMDLSPTNAGAPCDDESDTSTGAMQEFEKLTLYWNEVTDTYRISTKSSMDEGCDEYSVSATDTTYLDQDNDGYAEAEGDCNDLSNGVYPGHAEMEDGVDNDCDGTIDEGTSSHDDDGDGYSEDQGDCNDASNGVYPGHAELNDNVDNNCDGVVDNDVDQDGWTTEDGDCNDLSNGIYPTHPEDIDNRDNNCDGLIDNDPYPDLQVYYPPIGGWWTAKNWSGDTLSYYTNLFQGYFTQGAHEDWYRFPSETCDVNGDLFTDILVYSPAGEWTVIESDEDTLAPPTSLWAEGFGIDSTGTYTEAHCGDFNGDGLDDALLYSALGSFQVALSTGTSFSTPQEWCACGDQATPNDQFTLLTGDPNGDGLTDIIWMATNGSLWYVGLNQDPGFQWQLWYTTFGGEGYTPLIGDINGDGLDDIAIMSETDGHWNTVLSTGTSFADQVIWIDQHGGAGYQPFLEDMNADGLDDAVIFTPSNGSWSIALSTGSSFNTPSAWITDFGTDATGYYGVMPFITRTHR